ncbi:RNA polymerase sigma factor SigM [Virgibacillus soli]|uniref:RNA polymerase sigma factor SigM n=1 Tax=Lederbergia galactosidilytica TaxID=217031 RepID=A0A0Q9XYD3_9BACI|nr:RNA polymerase sigma factor SigM [Virgibacillus soli]KRG13638.1 RNA polymerase sigma factor SigM [Lederbergia galactosidilytica]OAK68584.1 RNA polymerase sigma factor SigM [Lederbergia galactosidilytica]
MKGGVCLELEDVYELYMNDLYRYLLSLSQDHYVAEDLLQEVFYKAFIIIDDYEFSHIKAWLFKVAYHTFIDYQRKNKRLVLKDNMEKHLQADYTTPEINIIEKEALTSLLTDLNYLKENEKQAILLSDFHELSYQEAADILEVKLNTFKSHLMRGRKKLVKIIKERVKQDDQ